HRQSECKKAGKRHLFVDSKGDDDAAYEEYEEALVYDEEPECEGDYVSGDVGVNLVVRRSCLTPKADGDDWLKHNICQSTCTISVMEDDGVSFSSSDAVRPMSMVTSPVRIFEWESECSISMLVVLNSGSFSSLGVTNLS
ncbi:hypothetical protein Tco_0114026, partial [Tanacetum coccineum]